MVTEQDTFPALPCCGGHSLRLRAAMAKLDEEPAGRGLMASSAGCASHVEVAAVAFSPAKLRARRRCVRSWQHARSHVLLPSLVYSWPHLGPRFLPAVHASMPLGAEVSSATVTAGLITLSWSVDISRQLVFPDTTRWHWHRFHGALVVLTGELRDLEHLVLDICSTARCRSTCMVGRSLNAMGPWQRADG